MCQLIQFDKDKYVADIKLRHIQNIVEQARKTKSINRIMLFGSAAEERCKETSDIDIAVFGSKTKSRYLESKEFETFRRALHQFDWNQDYDVLYFKEGFHKSAAIMSDIEHGVEIFRRNLE